MARSTAEAMEEQAETIANHIKKKNKQDDPLSELAKLEMIRDMSQCLTLKRSVKAKIISESLKSKRRPIGYWKNLRYKTSMTISKVAMNIFSMIDFQKKTSLYSECTQTFFR